MVATVWCGKISECDRAGFFCTQINPIQKKAERSQLRIDRLRLTTFLDFSVEHFFCMIFRFPVLSPSDSQHDLSNPIHESQNLRLQFAAAAMGFGKGGVNRPGTGTFCTRQQWKKGSKHGPASTPAQHRPKRKAAPATLVDKLL